MGNALSAADFREGQFICFVNGAGRAMLVHRDDTAKHKWTLEPSTNPADMLSQGDTTRVRNGLCDLKVVVLDLAVQLFRRAPIAYIPTASRISCPKEGRRCWFSLVEVPSTVILRVPATLIQPPVHLLKSDVLQS